MEKLKVAIIGCGNIFPMHAYPVSQLEQVELVAICDIKKDRAEKAAKEFNCKYYLDYKEMFDKEDLHVVHLCTPHYLHPVMAKDAAKKGIHVLTEKPMSIDYNDALDMIATAKENRRTLGVIFQNRYNAGSRLIKETLQSGELGRILSGRLYLAWDRSDEYYSKSDWKGTWDKEGGGVIIDQAIHTIDLANWFINKEILYVDSHISNRAHEEIEVEDAAEGVIKYKDGTVLAFHTINYYTYDSAVEIELHCEHGTVHMVSDKATIQFKDGRQSIAINDPREVFSYKNSKSYWGVSHIKQINNFYNTLIKNEKPDITGDEAIKTQQVICAIYDSGKTNKRIYF